MSMITDADIKKLIKEFTKIFTTKEDLRVLEENILDKVDHKLVTLREQIADDTARLITPYLDNIDNHDLKIKHLE